MTDKQYEKLNIGDLVTCYNGPNKDVVMTVEKKYLGASGTACLRASGIKPNTVYNQRKSFRFDNWTCGSAKCFKIIRDFA